MTKQELRETKSYSETMEKIKNYSRGFEFTIYYSKMPKQKANAIKAVLKDAEKERLVECIAFGEDLSGNCTEETYRRI